MSKLYTQKYIYKIEELIGNETDINKVRKLIRTNLAKIYLNKENFRAMEEFGIGKSEILMACMPSNFVSGVYRIKINEGTCLNCGNKFIYFGARRKKFCSKDCHDEDTALKQAEKEIREQLTKETKNEQ